MEETEVKNEGVFSVAVCSTILQRQKRVLSELKDQANILPKKVKAEDIGLSHDDEKHDVKIECQQVVGEFKKLKFAFVHLQSQIKLLDYLENVPRDQWPSVACCDEDSKKIRRQLKDAKADAKDLEEHLQAMMKAVQNCQETLDVNLDKLEKMVEEAKVRAAEVEQLLEARKGDAVALLQSSGVTLENFQDEFDKQNDEFNAAANFLRNHEPVLRSIQEGTESIRKEQEVLLRETQAATEKLSQLLARQQDKDRQQSDKMKWCESASKLLTQLTGVSEQSFEDNCWTLELTADGCSPSSTESMSALLSLHFKPGAKVWSAKQLSTASVSIDTLDISDLVEEATRRNSVAFLVSAVMKRLKSHAPLFMEVEQLRHQYAIDWVPEEGILRVIFGDSAQIVCTLSLATGAQGTTLVQLKSVEGAGQHPPIEELKPSKEEPRISDWLAYLQEAMRNM